MPDDKKSNDLNKPNEKRNGNNQSSEKGNNCDARNHHESTDQSHLIKWILFTFLIAGIGLLSESIYESFMPSVDQIEMQSLNHFVSKDLYETYKEGLIPKSFFQLREITWSYYDDDLKMKIPPESIPFKTSAGGLYKLEVDAFSSQKEDTKIAILQMNLIEIKSGNKVWELSRNYEIKNSK